jgi:hypothetical protein
LGWSAKKKIDAITIFFNFNLNEKYQQNRTQEEAATF